ncbi:MAG: hypothetical protein A2161_12445 [Candidatus Schekmanbacteria bacterium RBG_13_48_7]|uniref:Uncharacterized protein n=1 Tax=Candidatus Schekmanbacteria bacterium RBG_13_48_7 TaxID=1817878 RepID=A0A1F7RKC7_9BACT|nr:MAG: hypothetical protein A2161_12445 [Candidatus Schekmanbacteria bacterium RBG_13_48_7]
MEKIGFIVKSDDHERKSWELVLKMGEVAQSTGYEIQIFAMMNGIYHLLQGRTKKDEPDPKVEAIEKIMDRGAKIMVFGISAQERGFESAKQFIDGVKMGGMTELANMIGACDQVICL